MGSGTLGAEPSRVRAMRSELWRLRGAREVGGGMLGGRVLESVLERETWEAFWEGGPRKRDGGGSRRCLGFDLGDA